MKASLKSFACVSDLITIHPYPCVTPDRIHEFDIPWNETKHRSPKEKATLLSHYDLWQYDRCMIMEHDAYLLDEEAFRLYFKDIDECQVWMPGIAVECYSLSSNAAENASALLEHDIIHKNHGPMGTIFHSNKRPGNVYFPCDHDNVSCAWSPVNCISALKLKPDAKLLPLATTQMMDISLGTTIDDRTSGKDFINNPKFKYVTL